MSESPQTLVTFANRILAHENVLDAFGHVSIRNPKDAGRFFLPRSIAPELVTEGDVLEFDLTGETVTPTTFALYTERVIHSVIYKMRPDVQAICHHHAPAIMPFCLTDLKLRVVTQLGASIGKHVPLWDQRETFGATNHLVTREDEAVEMTECLGANNIVLMKRHGATVVAGSIRELTFRSVYSCRDADLQLRALSYGDISCFDDTEIDLAAQFPEASLSRAWEYWRSRLPKG